MSATFQTPGPGHWELDRSHFPGGTTPISQWLMTEAVAAAIRYAFEDLRLHRVKAAYLPTNERSGRLLRRLGFVVEGYARDYLLIQGRWQDQVLVALINPDWRAPD